MRKKKICRLPFLIYFAVSTTGTALAVMPAGKWPEITETFLGCTQEEASKRLGMPKVTEDGLLSATVAEYFFVKNDEGIQSAEIFYESGFSVALRVRFTGDGRLIMKRFVSLYPDEIIASGDLHAIARAADSCDLYRVVEVNERGAFVYQMRDSFYRRMAYIGEVPSLPERRGHAA